MNVVLDCIPCYIKQSLNALAQTDISEEKGREIIHQTLPLLPQLKSQASPAENSTLVLREINRLLGNEDPFYKAKKESNDLALKLLPELQAKTCSDQDPLFTSLKMAVAGNIIDMGIFKDFDVEKSIHEAMVREFARDAYFDFRQRLQEAKEVLILGDNSGEIVFDRLLVQQLSKSEHLKITYAVKGQPILNDATMEDAVYVGMTEDAHVISNGSGFLGTILKDCSKEFLDHFKKADVIICKGQANYESLEALGKEDRRLFFLLKAKCEIVADNLGVQLGDMVFCLS